MKTRAAVQMGVTTGAIAGGILAGLAMMAGIFQGSVVLSLRGGSQTISLLYLVLAYIVGGTATGFMASLLHPLAKWTLGAPLVGIISSIPLGIGLVYSMLGTRWTEEHTILLFALCVLLGGTVGITLRKAIMDT